MNTKHILLPLALIAMALSSCYPPYPYQPVRGGYPDPAPGNNITSGEQADIREARDRAREGETTEDPSADPRDPASNPPSRKDYRVAIPIPGKEGFVFNPFTNDPVDVRAIPPGTLVRDPNDPDPEHKFRVP
jgi:hypothetical protein